MAKQQQATASGGEMASDVPIESVQIADDELWADGPPYALFKRMRGECPIHWSPAIEQFPEEEGFWSVTTAEDVHAVSHDWKTYSSAQGFTALTHSVLPLEF